MRKFNKLNSEAQNIKHDNNILNSEAQNIKQRFASKQRITKY